jgi:hypothetical protein
MADNDASFFPNTEVTDRTIPTYFDVLQHNATSTLILVFHQLKFQQKRH